MCSITITTRLRSTPLPPACPPPEHQGRDLEQAHGHGGDAQVAVGGVRRHAAARGVLHRHKDDDEGGQRARHAQHLDGAAGGEGRGGGGHGNEGQRTAAKRQRGTGASVAGTGVPERLCVRAPRPLAAPRGSPVQVEPERRLDALAVAGHQDAQQDERPADGHQPAVGLQRAGIGRQGASVPAVNSPTRTLRQACAGHAARPQTRSLTGTDSALGRAPGRCSHFSWR